MYHFLDQQGNIDTQREEAYRTAIESPGRPPDYVYGTVYFEDEELEPLDIDNTNMPQNAVSISKQCVDDNALMFGGVFTSVLNLSITTDLDRYAFYNAKIVLKYDITVGYTEPEQEGDEPEPIYETVPLGIFYVAEADRPGNTVNLIAYDSITKLDISLNGTQLSGTAWQLFEATERITGYEMGFSEEDLQVFPNYDELISASEVDGLHTYRDVVKEICQLLGCFATDNREGKLILKSFSTTSDLTLDISDWYSMTPADYKCNYIGVSITSRAGTYTKTDEEHPNRVGLIWTIPDAPAWDYGLDEAQERKTNAIYDVITAITYTPASIDMPGDVTFDCGDMFELIPRNADPADPDTHIKTIATSIEWKFHQGMTIESVGINPYIEGSSVASTGSTDRLVAQAVERSKIQFLNFTNLSEIIIGTTDPVLIGTYHFAPTNTTTALFVATILVDADVDDDEETTSSYTEEVSVPVVPYYNDTATTVTDINGNPVTFSGTVTNTHTHTYQRDGDCDVSIYYTMIQNSGAEHRVPSDEEPYLAIEKLHNGEHIITVSYVLTGLQASIRYEFNVYMTVNGGTITLPIRTLQATLIGQEIDELDKFNGELIIDDERPMRLVDIGVIDTERFDLDAPVVTYIDDPEETPYTPMPNQIAVIKALPIIAMNEAISLYNIDSVEVIPLTEGTGQLIPHVLFYSLYMSDESDNIFETEDGTAFETEGMST